MRLLHTYNTDTVSPHEVLHLKQLDVGEAFNIPSSNKDFTRIWPPKIDMDKTIRTGAFATGG